jgi:hypothetical protein
MPRAARIAGWIMRHDAPLAVLTSFTFELMQEKPRPRPYLPGLKHFRGTCAGVLLIPPTHSHLSKLIEEPALIVLYEARVFGPAFLDCTTRRRDARFTAIFIPAGAWQRLP